MHDVKIMSKLVAWFLTRCFKKRLNSDQINLNRYISIVFHMTLYNYQYYKSCYPKRTSYFTRADIIQNNEHKKDKLIANSYHESANRFPQPFEENKINYHLYSLISRVILQSTKILISCSI
ncbi:hypothetical protein CHS0354_012220 [Potamilus streckersoni]|uniref:Uncharacterized protein n=1 Tax=Potamilus streckersoni TaxID=2493646 RepID=A0AAE0SA57_9BIVA|nr:hypothetical protein CHS0354_012220 [Potamilus streckersoni]